MKQIIIHGLVQDNTGTYHQCGATLAVNDAGREGCITTKAAAALVETGCAREAPPAGKAKPATA